LSENPTLPKPPQFPNSFISAEEKTENNKIDIVGFFSQKRQTGKGDLGLIE
jgi:hypothetical protein